MKYKNFERADTLVRQIRKNEHIIRQLSWTYTTVALKENNGTLIQTVGTGPGCEHDLTDFAVEMVEKCKSFYQNQIDKWLLELENL